MKQRSFSTWFNRLLFFWVLLPVLGLLLAAGLFSGWYQWQQLRRSHRMLSFSIARYVNGFLVQAASGLNLLERRMHDHTDPSRVLEEFSLNNPLFDRVILFSSSTNVVAVYPGKTSRPDYGPLLESSGNGPEGTRLTTVYFARRDGQLTVGLYKRLADRRMLLGELKLSTLQRFVYRIQLDESRRQVFVTDQYGNLIAHPDFRQVQRRENFGFLRVFRKKSPDGYTVEPYSGALWLFRIVPIERTHWRVVVGFPFRRLWLPVLQIFAAVFLTVGIAAGAMVAVVRSRVRRKVSAPLEELSGQAVALQLNREAAAVTEEAGITELQQLTEKFVEMNRAVREREQHLSENRSRLNLALSGADLGSWDWHIPTGDAVFDRRWAGMLGYRLSELQQHFDTFKHLLHPEDLDAVEQALQEHFSGKTVQYEVEVRMLTRDGSWRWILARGRVVERDDAGAPVRMSGTHLDITARKQIEHDLIAARDAAEQASRAKSSFLALITHEIRTPLNAIIGYTRLMLERQEELNRERLSSVQRSAQALLALVNSILDFSRFEISRPEPVWRPVDLGSLAAEAEDFFALEAQQRGLTYTVRVDETLPPSIVSDANRLRQILLNLITNAFKFTGEGEVSVVMEPAENGAGLLIRVADSGPGIPAHEQALIFEPFKQAESGLQRRFGGVGLGLAIARQSAELLGGTITVESEPGRGTVFLVKLPEAAQHSAGRDAGPLDPLPQREDAGSSMDRSYKLTVPGRLAAAAVDDLRPKPGVVDLEELDEYISALFKTAAEGGGEELRRFALRLQQAAAAMDFQEIDFLLALLDRDSAE